MERKVAGMKVIVKNIGKPAEVVNLDCKYRNEVAKLISSERITKEYVELVPYKLDMVVDEDGLFKNLPFNFFMEINNSFYPVQMIVGTVVFCHYEWQDPFETELWDFELRDVTEEDIITVNRMLTAEKQRELSERFWKS